MSAKAAGVSISTTTSERINLGDVKRKSVRGGMVTFASQGVSVAIQLTSTVILARLLQPADYGIMAMVAAITAFAGLFRDLGLSAAAVQKQSLTHAQQSNLFWINVALGTILSILLAALSPLVAWFYGKPEVRWVAVALSFSFIIGSLSAQSSALLVREMHFGRQAVAGISGALIGLMVSVVLAWLGFQYWSLVWGQLAGGITTTIFLISISTFRPGFPSRNTGMKEMLKFGANITVFDFVNYFHRNLDNILIGRLWGAGALGLYSRAYSLLMFPINNIRGPINAVAFPAMSRMQHEPEAFRAYYRRITSILAFISMPLIAYLFVVADPLIRLALGEQWSGTAPLFSVLAISAFIQPVASLRGVVLLSMGQGKRYAMWGFFNAICVSIGVVCGIAWGAMGVATAYAVVNYAILYPSLLMAFKHAPLKCNDFFGAIVRPAVASISSSALCCVVMNFTPTLTSAQIVLGFFCIFLGGYLTIYVLIPGGRKELINFITLAIPAKRHRG